MLLLFCFDTGERFPEYDPNMQPRLTPRPDDDAVFLQGIFEGLAVIEARAYDRLGALGASPLKRVKTAGGGSKNPVWTQIRRDRLNRLGGGGGGGGSGGGVVVERAEMDEASFGAALLARKGWKDFQKEKKKNG